MARTIQCEQCLKHLGELRDATLRKGVVFMCAECNSKRKLAAGIKEMSDIFKGWDKP